MHFLVSNSIHFTLFKQVGIQEDENDPTSRPSIK